MGESLASAALPMFSAAPTGRTGESSSVPLPDLAATTVFRIAQSPTNQRWRCVPLSTTWHVARAWSTPAPPSGFGKPIKLREQQRHLPLVEDGIPIGIQSPQHRKVHRVQRREEVRPLQSVLGSGRELPPVPAHLHVDHSLTLPAFGAEPARHAPRALPLHPGPPLGRAK